MTKATDRAVETDWATKAAQSAFKGRAMDDYDDIIAATAVALRKERESTVERCALIADARATEHRTELRRVRLGEALAIAATIRATLTPRGE